MSERQTAELSDEQKQFLQGFAMGSDVARAVRGLPILSGSVASESGGLIRLGPAGDAYPVGSYPLQNEAQDRLVAAGKKLSLEESAKRDKDPLAMWDEIGENASRGKFPKGMDVFLYKFSGLFHVAPAQDSFMTRLRFPGGLLTTSQLRGVAEIAETHGVGHADVTTRANLQIREIPASKARKVLVDLADLGIINRGSGADNIRNITATATSGIDPEELIETIPLAKEMHHYILNHREMYGLPRKFNIAFDGRGRIASLEDTNDIGFTAVRLKEENATADVPSGVYFLLTLGGITGHKDFAKSTGVVVSPNECVELAAAIVRVYLKHGDRSNRKKARLKYLLDEWGFERFLTAVETERRSPLLHIDLTLLDRPVHENRWAHVGVHRQKQRGKYYIGVVLPVGRLTAKQMRSLSAIADQYGSGTIRLTVWQNLLIPDVDDHNVDRLTDAIRLLGLEWEASSVRAGLVACTGSAGCKFAGADTKRHAMELARYLEERLTIDRPINIHVTGCHHSCAQHYIGDIGLEATKVEVNEEMVDGYHLYVGGGWGAEQSIGRPLIESLPFEEVSETIERLLRHYLDSRESGEEPFAAFVRRQSTEELQAMATSQLQVA